MEIKGIYNSNKRPDAVPSPSNAAPSTEDEVRNMLTQLKAKGIKDWEILDAWSQIAYEQGNVAIADSLASAAFELGKPVE